MKYLKNFLHNNYDLSFYSLNREYKISINNDPEALFPYTWHHADPVNSFAFI